MMDELLVWWLDQYATTIVEYEADCQQWTGAVRDEITSMYGRAPRGRLWVTPSADTSVSEICVPDEFRHLIDESRNGLVLLKTEWSQIPPRIRMYGYLTNLFMTPIAKEQLQ